MIKVTQLNVKRESNSICSVDVLTVSAGDRLTIIGSNGSGKTTLLRILAGLERDYSGNCRVDVGYRERTYLHQQPYLFRGTVLANVQYGQQGRGDEQAEAWLDRLGVGHLVSRSTENLSGGEIRRVALARSLACQPRLLLLDEPLAELDPAASETVCKVLNSLQDTTVIIASPTELLNGLATSTYYLKT
jgi:tungstate transport system ATP-binding protein